MYKVEILRRKGANLYKWKITIILTTSSTSAIFANTSLFKCCKSGTDLRKLILS